MYTARTQTDAAVAAAEFPEPYVKFVRLKVVKLMKELEKCDITFFE